MRLRWIGRHRISEGSLDGPQVHSLFDDGATALAQYGDPPWGDGNVKYWATKASKDTGRAYHPLPYDALIDAWMGLAVRYAREHVFLETGLRWEQDSIERMQAIGLRSISSVRLLYRSGSKRLENVLIHGSFSGEKVRLNQRVPASAGWCVPIEQVEPNDYNPNSVAPNEMRLLHTSISHDGYTQPVVAIWDDEAGKYVIVDGFHRWSTAHANADIREATKGLVPVVVIEKPINDRMASTIRHNRARGKHSIDGMADMVFAMLEEGWSDADICNEIGTSPEELIRLKHVTGFSKLAENAEYSRAWRTARMAKFEREYRENGTVQEADGGAAASDGDAGEGAGTVTEF